METETDIEFTSEVKKGVASYKNIIKRIKHARYRIAHFKNWYLLFPPFNRMEGERVLNLREGTRFIVRSVYSKEGNTDFSILREVWMGTAKHYGDLLDTDCIFDIGAHVGASAIYLTKHTNAKIYAFEPDKDNFRILKRNVELNGLQNRIIPLNIAVWKKDEIVKLSVHATNKGGHSITKTYENAHTYEVQAKTISTILREHNISRVSFLKCDVEGAEFEIFHNTPQEVFDKIDSGMIELHGKNQETYRVLKSFIQSKGYTTEFVVANMQRPDLRFYR